MKNNLTQADENLWNNKNCSGSSESSLPPPNSSGNNSVELINEVREGKPAQNQVANLLAPILSASLAFDEITEEWLTKDDLNIWRPVSKTRAESIVESKLSIIKEKYAAGYLAGIFRFLRMRLIVPPFTDDRRLLPLENGVFDVKRKIMFGYQDYCFNWQLPYSYNKNAQCPRIDSWLRSVTDNNEEMIHFLLCWMMAVLTGRYDLQKYVEVIGHGGTGKGTFSRLLTALVGDTNVMVTDLKALEQNRFETAQLYGKRFVLVTDAAHFSGETSVFKSITGGDPVRFEKKGINAGQPFVVKGLVQVAANENIQTSDHTSGLSRRRITLPFNQIVSDLEKEKFPDFEKSLTDEIPGLLNKLVELDEKTVAITIRNPGRFISRVKFQAELDTNPILSWINDSLTWCAAGNESQVGKKTLKDEKPKLERLYPHYIQYCEQQGRQSTSLTRFSALVVDNCVSRGIETSKTRNSAGATILRNIRLKNNEGDRKSIFSEGALKIPLKGGALVTEDSEDSEENESVQNGLLDVERNHGPNIAALQCQDATESDKAYQEAEVLINSLELLDDQKFVRKCLAGKGGIEWLDLIIKYLDQWKQGVESEPNLSKKTNAGRYRANKWCRETLNQEERY